MKYLKVKKISNDLIGCPVVYRKHWDDEANRNGWKGIIVAVRRNRVTIEWTSAPNPNYAIKRQEYDASAILTDSNIPGGSNYIFVLETSQNEVTINPCRIYDFNIVDTSGDDHPCKPNSSFTSTIVWEDEEQEHLATIEYNVENSGKALLKLESVDCDFLDSSDLLSINEAISNLEKQIKSCDRWIIEEGDLILMDTRTYGLS